MRALAALALLAALSGCGLQPMYAGGGSGAVAQGLAAIDVPPIEGRAGWLVRNALNERLGQRDDVAPRYRLDVLLDDQLEGLGLLTGETIGRERRTLRARYQLVDLSTGRIIVDATAGSDAGIDVVSSEFARKSVGLARELDAFAGIRQHRHKLVGCGGCTSFVGTAEERNAGLLRRARCNRGEVFLGRLHACSRNATVTRVRIRSATSRDRFSSAVCSTTSSKASAC